MPAVSEKQRSLMEAVAHNPAFAKKVGIAQSVGKEFVGKDGKSAQDMTDEECDELSSAFSKWIKEEKQEPEHAADKIIAFDDAALSSRRIDEDGRLHVFPTNISKANVCPYRGSEIPGSEALNLDPNKIYMLLRDPNELAKAAATFNNVPLLTKHVPVNVDEPMPHLVVGSTGTDATFNSPYLVNSLVVWDAGAIAGIEHNQQKELSCAYRYDADMTPGEYEGVKYDGAMRNIRANHVALVESGRAGSDVVVGDENPREDFIMPVKARPSYKSIAAFGAITGFIAPKLAMDQKFDALPVKAILSDTNAKNWLQRKPRLAEALRSGMSKIALDADMEDIHKLLDSLDDEDGMAGDEDKDDEDKKKAAEDEDKDDDDKDKKAEDEEDDDDKKKDDKKAEDGEETAGMDKKGMDKKAMDAAIASAVKQSEARTVARMRAVQDAEKIVRPLVGDVAAMDSAEDIYRFALDQRGVDLTGVHKSAYKPMVEMMLKQDADRPVSHISSDGNMAHDSAGSAALDKWVPDVKRIGLV